MTDIKPANQVPHPSLDELRARILDLIIVGGGPAGMSAAVYASRRKIDTLMITENIGGQTNWSAEVENYLGFDMISGFDLSQKFFDHVKKIDDNNNVYDLEVLQNDRVMGFSKADKVFTVQTKTHGAFTARAILITTGAKPRVLNIPGEKELIGKGVTFCATCDGPLYHGKTIAIIGGGNSAMEAALYLAKIAKQVYLVNINENLRGEMAMAEELGTIENVELKNFTETLEFQGEGKLQKARFKDKHTGKEEWLELDGVFEEIGYTPNSDDFKGLVDMNERGEIIIDQMNQTSVPGVFAAGDVSSIPVKQIVVAAGEGAKASLAVYNYLLPAHE